ncbi:MAG: NAD(P)/FAD-dependent oxidoreductase [Gammaproteobacteria bacterium]|nr:NAD(P)/FAD-dependent oxidoreductase [Gammaproteobacteria bacterium]MYD79048.1 NAD(P)/FAD-dependent oxidoreductase [Gammaproteobacteria bacterium]
MPAKNEVLIIGGGHNGLVCACYLANAGMKVRVFERHSEVGGAAITEEFHPGFRNSIASYTVGLLDPDVIRDLRLYEHGLRIVPRPIANFFPISDDESLNVYNDDKDSASEFARFSANDSNALFKFKEMLSSVGDVARQLMKREPPRLGGGWSNWVGLLSNVREFRSLAPKARGNLIDLFVSPITQFLSQWFENPHIQAAFAFDAVVGSHISLNSAGTSYGLLHHALGQVIDRTGAWGHAIGGMGAITQAMKAEAVQRGVHIYTDSEVVEVTTYQNLVRGIKLKDGTEFEATTIVANVAPQHLYLDLLDEGTIGSNFRDRIKNLRSESAVLRINVALSELPQFTCKANDTKQDHLQSGIVIGPTLEYMETAYLGSRLGNWSTSPVIEMLIPSIVDDTLAPPHKHVASLFCQHFPRDRDWENLREEAADTIFATIDKFAPNFSSSVISRQVLTPLDLERRFRLPGGDIFHIAHILNQLWGNRPVMGFGAYRGPISGLYHCGAGSHPGGGVTGIPGRNAARAILSDG